MEPVGNLQNRRDKIPRAATSRPRADSPRKASVWRSILSEDRYFQWLLIMPLLIVLAFFMVYPTIYCLFYSFQEYSMRGAPRFVGLENYRSVLHNAAFWAANRRTLLILVLCIFFELVIGMAIALFLNRDFKGQNIVRGLCLLPLMISPLAMSMMWNFILQFDFGIVNQIISVLGGKRIMWWTPERAIYSVAFTAFWQWLPFSVFVLLAGLKGLPRDAFEAARVDRGSPLFIFRRLTLPMLKPLIIIIILLRTMWLIRLFDPLYGTTHGGVNTETLDWLVYRVSFVYFDIGQGSALALISLFITMVVCAIMYKQLLKALGVGQTR